MTVTLETILHRNGEIIYAPTGPGDAVMMSIAADRYYGLNAVGSRIWELLDEPKTVAELSRRIVEEFEVDLPTCEAAVMSFVGDLIDSGIVHDTVP